MPRTRPREISNGISLSDKLRREDRPLVSEHGAVDAVLLWDGVINKASPNKESVGVECSEYDMLAWADELTGRSVAPIGAVMPFVEFEAGLVAIFREPPMGHITVPLAKADTRPKGRDAKLARALPSGAVREAHSPKQPAPQYPHSISSKH